MESKAKDFVDNFVLLYSNQILHAQLTVDNEVLPCIERALRSSVCREDGEMHCSREG